MHLYCLVKFLLVPLSNSDVLVQIDLVLPHLTLADEHYLLQLAQLEPPTLRPGPGLEGQLSLLAIHLPNSLLRNTYKASYQSYQHTILYIPILYHTQSSNHLHLFTLMK